jgi:prevent-host-death family protein
MRMNTQRDASKRTVSHPTPVSSTELQRNFGNIVRRVYTHKEHLVIERGGLPVMVILPVPEYEMLTKKLP